MKVKTKKLLAFMRRGGMGIDDLAYAMGVSLGEVEKLISGKAVGVNTTRKFIRYFSADEAQAMIDWEAFGETNPLDCEADAGLPDDEDYDDDENCFDGEDEDGEVDEETFEELLDEDERFSDGFLYEGDEDEK